MPPAFLLATSAAVAKPGGWQRIVPLTVRLYVTNAMPGLLMTGAISGDMD